MSECAPDKSTDQWCEALGNIDVPFAPVNDVASLLNDPHLTSQNFFTEYDHPTEGRLRNAASPFFAEGIDQVNDIPPPRLGQDTADILQNLGFQTSEIDAMQNANVVLCQANEKK